MSNNWDGKGLPPAGTTVEYTAIDYDHAKPAIENGKWYRGTIIAYYEGWVWTSDNGIRSVSNTAFRPIKSDRDKAVEDIIKYLRITNQSDYEIAEKIYDAGYRKTTSGE